MQTSRKQRHGRVITSQPPPVSDALFLPPKGFASLSRAIQCTGDVVIAGAQELGVRDHLGHPGQGLLGIVDRPEVHVGRPARVAIALQQDPDVVKGRAIVPHGSRVVG